MHMWRFNEWPLANLRSHGDTGHTNGLYPVCELVCRRRLVASANARLQPGNVHLCGFSPVWTRMCLFSVLCSAKRRSHWGYGQANLRSPVCLWACRFAAYAVQNLSAQPGKLHVYRASRPFLLGGLPRCGVDDGFDVTLDTLEALGDVAALAARRLARICSCACW